MVALMAVAILSMQGLPEFSADAGMWERLSCAAEKCYTEGQANDRFIRQYKDGPQLKSGDNEWDASNQLVSANMVFPHVNVQKSELHAHEPQIQVDPTDNAGGSNEPFERLAAAGVISGVDAGKRIFADALEDMLTHSYRRTYTNAENAMVVQDVFLRGMGVTKESFDTERKLDRSDRLFRHEVFVDSVARHTVRQARFIIHTVAEPIHKAQTMFQGWQKLGLELTGEVKANYSLMSAQGLEGARGKNTGEYGENDCFRYQEIWLKDGDKREVHYYNPIAKQYIMKLPVWPCGKLEVDDFPFSFCAFNRQGVTFSDAFSELEVIEKMRESYARLVAYLDELTKRGMAPLLVVDADLDAETIKKIRNGKTFDILPIKALGENLNNKIKLLEFSPDKRGILEHLAQLGALCDQIVGLDEILRGAQGREGMTAREAAIREAQAKSRTGLKVRDLDEFFGSQARHRAQITRQRTPIETVKAVCGPVAAIVWQAVAGSLDDLLAEYTVGVAAGSTGVVAKQTRMDRAERLRQAGHQENQASLAVGGPPVVDTLELLKEAAREDDYRNLERIFPTPAPQAPQPMAANPNDPMAAPAPSLSPAAGLAGGGGAPGVPPAAAPVGAVGPESASVQDPNQAAAIGGPQLAGVA